MKITVALMYVYGKIALSKPNTEDKAMYDTTHYAALMTRLSNEKGYLALATKQSEIELRSVWIKQIEKEISQEVEFLKSKGVDIYHSEADNDLTDDDLFNELFGE